MENSPTEHIDIVSGPAGGQARWHEFLSLFDLHVSSLPGEHNTGTDALSRWAYLASKGLQTTHINGSEQDRHVVIERDQKEKKVIRRECMHCSVKLHALPCHDITAFSVPAHAHDTITKSLEVVENVKDSSSGNLKQTEYIQPVSGNQLIQGIKRWDPAKSPTLPKDSLIIRD